MLMMMLMHDYLRKNISFDDLVFTFILDLKDVKTSKVNINFFWVLIDWFQVNFLFYVALFRLGAKLAIVGSAVYFTYENNVFDKSEYANAAITRVKTSFADTDDLLKRNVTPLLFSF